MTKEKKEIQEPVITTEKISKSELAAIFHSARATKVTIKHVEYETKVDVELLIKNFKEHSTRLLDGKMQDLNRKYEEKIQLLNLTNLGFLLKEMYSLMTAKGWLIGLENGSLISKKIFNPEFPIITAHKAGQILTYVTPICHLKEIKVFLDGATVYRIDVISNGLHPNVNGISAACTGDLSRIKIDLSKPKEIVDTLLRIESTYKLPNLDSPHHVPTTEVLKTERRSGVWGSN